MDFRDVPRVSSAPPICEGSPRILLVSPRAERHRQLTEILDGLKAGDRYVTRNSFILKADLGKGTAEHED